MPMIRRCTQSRVLVVHSLWSAAAPVDISYADRGSADERRRTKKLKAAMPALPTVRTTRPESLLYQPLALAADSRPASATVRRHQSCGYSTDVQSGLRGVSKSFRRGMCSHF